MGVEAGKPSIPTPPLISAILTVCDMTTFRSSTFDRTTVSGSFIYMAFFISLVLSASRPQALDLNLVSLD